MKLLGVVMMVAGITGAWGGPIDREYAQDWIVFLFAMTLFVCGAWAVSL